MSMRAKAVVEFTHTYYAELDVEGFLAEWEKEWIEFLEGDPPDGADDDDRREFISEALLENGVAIFYDAGDRKPWLLDASSDDDVDVRITRLAP